MNDSTAEEVQAMASDLRNAPATSVIGTHVSVPVLQAAAVCAALTEHADLLERQAAGVTDAREACERISGFIDKQLVYIAANYPHARLLDAGPVLRNMRRYKSIADEALKSALPVAAEPAQPADSWRVGDGSVIREVIGELRLEAPKRPSAHYLADKLDAALAAQPATGACGEKCHRIQENRDYWYGIAEQYRQELYDAKQALAAQGQGDAVAWMSPGRERLEFSRPDTVYGSHTIPLYTHPASPASPAGVPDGYVLVPETVGDADAFDVLYEYQQLGRTRKDAYRIAIRRLAERASEMLAAPSAASQESQPNG